MREKLVLVGQVGSIIVVLTENSFIIVFSTNTRFHPNYMKKKKLKVFIIGPMNRIEPCHSTFLLKQISGQDSVLHQAKNDNEK